LHAPGSAATQAQPEDQTMIRRAQLRHLILLAGRTAIGAALLLGIARPAAALLIVNTSVFGGVDSEGIVIQPSGAASRRAPATC
jgi:hypothetical protein